MQNFLLLFLIGSAILTGQENKLSKNYFALPNQISLNEFKHIISLSSARLPEDFIEEASDYLKAPLIGYSAQYGLPHNFLLNGNVKTNIITWQIAFGAKWNYTIDKFSFALGYDLAFVYGQLKQFGFNSKINAWINYPNVNIGYEFNKFAISLLTEAIVITSISEYADDLEISNNFNEFAGVAFTAVIEQPLWKDHFLSIGLKLNYVKFYYPTWAAYSTFDRYFWIPEFKVGLVL